MSRNSRGTGRSSSFYFTLSVITLVVVIAIALVVMGFFTDNLHIAWSWFLNDVWRGALFPNGWNLLGATPFFWLLVLIVGGFMLIATSGGEHDGPTLKATAGVVIAALVWGGFTFVTGIHQEEWNGQHYNAKTTYLVEDTDNVPNSLLRIHETDGAQIDVEEGVMPAAWDTRVASATGAEFVMRRGDSSIANTELLGDTLAYIYEDEGKGMWTGIRNGTNRQPIHGITTWRGTGESTQSCEFKGSHELNLAFNSSWGKNLTDEIYQYNPSFMWSLEDTYGYCDGDKPVIVIPGVKSTGTYVRQAYESYGVLTITGSPWGDPVFKFMDTVKPGDLPGPAYPVALTSKQRDSLSASAGFLWNWEPTVGYEPSNSITQSGNSTDFLLRDKEDGRLYWVTPMKPRNTDEHTIVAYGIIPADEITKGELNDHRVYVLNDGDQNIVNFSNLNTKVSESVKRTNPGFFTGNDEETTGQLAEFTPTGLGQWKVFAEMGGQAVYEIDVTGGSSMRTEVIDLTDENLPDDQLPTDPANPPSPTQVPTTEPIGCDEPASLSNEVIAYCIDKLSDELVDRYQQTPGG